MHVLFCGSGEFGVPCLRALGASGHEIALVLSQPDRPAGRGRKLTPTPIAAEALSSNLPLIRTENINSENLPAAEVMVVIAFGQKISPENVSHCRLGAINLHASILPKCRGAAPINWTILRGEAVAGNSVIRLAQKMDAGAILAQSQLVIGELETAGELHDRLAEDGAQLVLGVLDQLERGSAVETPQDEARATSAPKLTREFARLDFGRPAIELARHVRGLYPWPGCRVRLCDAAGAEKGRLTLVRARAGTGEGSRWQCGEIQENGYVAAGERSALEVLEVQPESKSPMSLDAYRRGHPWIAGARIESI
ncbi:MAG TPA: methionyl-tRNA formyltransferase [Tepidisphaeraceae bacterium]|jgi:methionyl-tRNA formyltransferase